MSITHIDRSGDRRAVLATDAKDRKATPIFSGFVKYFPRAMAEVARLSKTGNDQHNPGKPLHWDRTKSLDHGDCIIRHQIDVGTLDTDGHRHATKVAWRAMAQLETELEQAEQPDPEVILWPAVRPDMAAAFETTDIGELRFGRAAS